jgi:putative transposase
MARLARIVIPEVPHHVTQRGNRRLPIFFSDDDRILYRTLIAEACAAHGTRCLAWCLMDNHVHLILVPKTEGGLRATLGEAHRRYARAINFREGWRGYLFQGRFASYPMDDAHLLGEVRYVERNPVAAKMVARAEDWRWSSARAHITGVKDGLTDIAALTRHVRNWRAMLAEGLAAGDAPEVDAAIEAAMRTGRPLGDRDWVTALEDATGRVLAPKRRGPKRQAGN